MKILQQLFLFPILYILISYSILFSQDSRFKHYTVEDGLSSLKVFNTVQDAGGYLWFATPAGVCRYDGHEFRTFTVKDGLPDNDIINIYEARDSSIWFISFNGKGSYFYHDSIHNFNPNGLFDDFAIRHVYLDTEGNWWFGSWDQGILKYRNGEIEKLNIETGLPDNWAHAQEDNKGNIWLASGTDYGILKNKEYYFYHLPDELFEPAQTPSLSIFSLNTGKVFGKAGQHLIQFEDSSYSIIYPEKSSQENFVLYYVKMDAKGHILVGSKNGAIELSPENELYKSRTYLEDVDVSGFLEDDEGNFWFTTLDKGVYFLSNKSRQISNYNEKNGLKSVNISSILKTEKGELILGSQSGILQLFTDSSYLNIDLNIDNTSGIIQDIYESNNVIWCGADQGLFILPMENVDFNRLKTFELTADNLSMIKTSGIEINKNYNHIAIGTKSIAGIDNDVWFSTYSKLLHLNISENNYFIREIDSARVTDLCYDNVRNRLWIGRVDGLDYLEADSIIHFHGRPELAGLSVTEMKSDDHGILWIGTNGSGVFAYADNFLLNISSDNGLLNDKVNDLFVADNDIWVATPKGLSKVVFNHADKTYRILNLTRADGLLSNEVNTLFANADTVYAGTSSGLSVFSNSAVTFNEAQPPVYITSFSIWGKDTVLLDEYSLNHSQSKLAIKYTGISFSSGSQMKYKFMLQGVDRNWNYTNLQEVSYPVLLPGSYKFIVKAINSDGAESREVAVIGIVIHPPFWQTIWFQLTVAASLLALISATIIFGMRRIRQRNEINRRMVDLRMKALQAQMNPHFMSNALTSIQHFIVNHDSESANIYLMKFAKLTRMVLESCRKDYVSLSEEIEMLTVYLELEALRFDGKISYYISLSENMNTDEIEIPSMLIQPYVENAIHHGLEPKSSNGKVEIDFTLDNGILKCVVTDDGVGRASHQPKALHKSRGMSIISEKLELLNLTKKGDVTITIKDLKDGNEKGSGTRVEILIPVSQTH